MSKIGAATARSGVEDIRLEAKAKGKDTKKKIPRLRPRQGQPFRGQTLSRPRTRMLEKKAKDQGHKRKCSSKKRSSKIFFQAISKKKKKKRKGFHKKFSGDLQKKTYSKNFFRRSTKFYNSKNSVVLEPRRGQFSRT